MNSEPVELVRVIRRMRGGSQAHLVEGNDGHFYVAKFKGNPQGNRTLINEWFAHELFRWFGISTPPLRVLRLTKAVQAISEDLVFQLGKTQVAVEPGLHLGSQCPVNPATTAIFDFLPRRILGGVTNLEDFGKALVLDQFLGQADARQAIFIRERSGKGTLHYRAYLIDHGWMFGGANGYSTIIRHKVFVRTEPSIRYLTCTPRASKRFVVWPPSPKRIWPGLQRTFLVSGSHRVTKPSGRGSWIGCMYEKAGSPS
jgi:hypothetical protein